MGQVLAISEGASIAIHAIILMAIHKEELLTTRWISGELKVSDNHCSKVMQRLAKAGYVEAVRGPKGGFHLRVDPKDITLLEIYNVIEGRLCGKHCLFKVEKCPADKCLFHDLTSQVNKLVHDFLSKNTIYDVIGNTSQSEESNNETKDC